MAFCNRIFNGNPSIAPIRIGGVTGATGPTGPTGPSGFAHYLNAANLSGQIIPVPLDGFPIPLPVQTAVDGFIPSADGTSFTVLNAGLYLISYTVRTAARLFLSSRVTVNGAAVPASVLSPALVSSVYSQTFAVNLAFGDVLQLELFGFTLETRLSPGNGASLTALQLTDTSSTPLRGFRR